MRAINWTPFLLDEGPRPKSGKSRPNRSGTILGGKSIGSNPISFLKEAQKKSS
jgi:hypothetical protein